MKISTYGTLRKGMPNFNAFKGGLEYLDTITLQGYKLWAKGHLPVVTRTGLPKHNIKVDLMFVDAPNISKQIDRMELQAGYHIDIVTHDNSPYKMYLFDHVPDGADEVLHGDWKRYVEEEKIYPYHR